MDLLHALLLGILQGITEFLPISSSAHLILVPVLAGWADQGVAFDLAVHVGTLLAVVLYFHRDVTALTRDGVASMVQKRFIGQGRLAIYIVIGTLPAAVACLLLLGLIDSQLRSVQIIFFTTPVFGLLLGWADWRPNRQREHSTLSWQDGVFHDGLDGHPLFPEMAQSLRHVALRGLPRGAGRGDLSGFDEIRG